MNENNNSKEKIIQSTKSNNTNKVLIMIIALLVIVIIAGGIYFVFIKKDDNTSNNNQGGNNALTNVNVYKTKDGKYTFKLLDNGKAFINDKAVIVEDKEENNRYIEIEGDFDPSPNYISGLEFVLDKETKLIVESPYYDENNKASDCGFDSYGEYARFCARCYGFNVLSINGWDFFEISSEIGSSDIYTTSWKKLGSADVDKIKYDEKGIYVCNKPFESTCESGETKYDVNGNIINN